VGREGPPRVDAPEPGWEAPSSFSQRPARTLRGHGLSLAGTRPGSLSLLTLARLRLVDALYGPELETEADEVRNRDRERLRKSFPGADPPERRPNIGRWRSSTNFNSDIPARRRARRPVSAPVTSKITSCRSPAADPTRCRIRNGRRPPRREPRTGEGREAATAEGVEASGRQSNSARWSRIRRR
jgi:hypothetical protein